MITKDEAIRILEERGTMPVFLRARLTVNSGIAMAVDPEWVLRVIRKEPDKETFYVRIEEGVLHGPRIVVGLA